MTALSEIIYRLSLREVAPWFIGELISIDHGNITAFVNDRFTG